MKKLFVLIAIFLIPLVSYATDITINCTLSRTSGFAPLAVWADCSLLNGTGTTATGKTTPYHDLSYVIDFSDTPSTFVQGSRGSANGDSSADDNTMYGPVAAHVYEAAGTYNVFATITDDTGTTAKTNIGTVVVSAFDGTGTNSICFSNSATFTGCPTNTVSQQVTTSDFGTVMTDAATGCGGVACKQIYLHGGDTFSTASTGFTFPAAGPGILSSFCSGGTGAACASSRATISSSFSATSNGTFLFNNGTTQTDWRVSSVTVSGAGGSSLTEAFQSIAQRSTFADVEISGFYYGVSADGQNGELMIWKSNLHAQSGGSGSGYSLYLQADNAGTYAAVIGSTLANDTCTGCTTNHLARFISARGVVYSDNTLDNLYGSLVDSIKVVGVQSSGGTLAIASAYYVISDNYISNGAGGCLFATSPGDGGTTSEDIHDLIIERNWWAGGCTQPIYLGGTSMSFRDNVIDMTGTGTGFPMPILAVNKMTTGIQPNNIWIYNNSIYQPDTYTESGGKDNAMILTQTSPMGNVYVKNNVAYEPNVTAPVVVKNGASATMTVANNTCGTGQTGELSTAGSGCVGLPTTNPYTSTTGWSPTNATPAAASYPIGTATTVPVYTDFFVVALSGTMDTGAVTTQAAPTDHGHGSFELFNIGWMVIGIGALLGSLLTLKGGPRWAHS